MTISVSHLLAPVFPKLDTVNTIDTSKLPHEERHIICYEYDAVTTCRKAIWQSCRASHIV
eukprot:scaffold22140_cov41-Prasinocladus_malaysianus.AAC.1